MSLVPPPRSFDQPAPATYQHSAAGSSSQQRVAGRRSSKQPGRPSAASSSLQTSSADRSSRQPSSSQPSSAAFPKQPGPSPKQQQRRNQALKVANQRLREPHAQTPQSLSKLGSSGSAASLAGAQIIAGDSKKHGAPEGGDSKHAFADIQRRGTSSPVEDDVAMLQRHLVGVEGASEAPAASESPAVAPFRMSNHRQDLKDFKTMEEKTPKNGSAMAIGDFDWKKQLDTAVAGGLNSSASAPVLAARTPAFGSPPLNALISHPGPDPEAHRILTGSPTPDAAATKVAALEMELRLVQNRLAAETRANKAVAEVVADESEKRRILELQLNEARSENRQLRCRVSEAEEKSHFYQEVADDLQHRMRQLEATTEDRLKRERGRAAVIARLEGILPKNMLLKALA